MSTLSPRYSLKRPDGSDPFLRADFVDNYNILDAAPGVHICTSSTRPAWGANQAGRTIIETDTGLEWKWSGTVFTRIHPRGVLGFAVSSTNVTSADSGTYAAAMSPTSATVLAGFSLLRVTFTWKALSSDKGWAIVSILQDGSEVAAASYPGRRDKGSTYGYNTPPSAGSIMVYRDSSQVTVGAHTFQPRIKGVSSSPYNTAGDSATTIEGDATTPMTMCIEEIKVA